MLEISSQTSNRQMMFPFLSVSDKGERGKLRGVNVSPGTLPALSSPPRRAGAGGGWGHHPNREGCQPSEGEACMQAHTHTHTQCQDDQ